MKKRIHAAIWGVFVVSILYIYTLFNFSQSFNKTRLTDSAVCQFRNDRANDNNNHKDNPNRHKRIDKLRVLNRVLIMD